MNGKKIPVILDTDIGGDIDDTWALGLLLKCPEFDVKLITTSTDNTPLKAKLVAKFLEIVGRTDIPIGIGPPENREPHPPKITGLLHRLIKSAALCISFSDDTDSLLKILVLGSIIGASSLSANTSVGQLNTDKPGFLRAYLTAIIVNLIAWLALAIVSAYSAKGRNKEIWDIS